MYLNNSYPTIPSNQRSPLTHRIPDDLIQQTAQHGKNTSNHRIELHYYYYKLIYPTVTALDSINNNTETFPNNHRLIEQTTLPFDSIRFDPHEIRRTGNIIP